VLVYGVVSYLAVFFAIRLAGKRTLATMNVFDLLATVALGSTLATFVIDDGVGFSGGAIALALPLALQWSVAYVSSRSRRAERFVKQHPAMLLWKGEYLEEMMKHEMITADDICEALRKAGLASYRDAKAVVLEVDGHLSVVRDDEDDPADETSVFQNVRRNPHGAEQ
jgi:uncharacterized membrane protein YcaP (DUF421 family)